ncbi:MAG: tetratricopeptide repeat protein [Verrucomicrobiota bacterium]
MPFLPHSLLAAIVLAWLFTPVTTFAHGDLRGEIDTITQQLAVQVDDVSLLLKRADLYRLHGAFGLALADCQIAQQAKPDFVFTHFVRGKIFSDAHLYEEARSAMDKFLAVQKENSEAHLARARVLVQLGDFENGAADYSAAIRFAKVVKPDFFVEQADVWRAVGKFETALLSLDEGIKKLGPIASLEIPAIELELDMRGYDKALARVDLLAAQSQRKEQWLFRRGEILEMAGRLSEAKMAYAKAAEAFVQLPLRFKQSESTKRIETQLAAANRRLETR